MKTGRKGNYYWIEWDERSKFLSGLLSDFPQLVLDNYLVNTSFDSGSLSLSTEDTERGWHIKDDLTYSPQIKTVEGIPGYGYNEWYVFDSPKELGDIEVFVNYLAFSLHNSTFEDIQTSFWQQIENIQPVSFLAEGDNLICVNRDKNLFDKIISVS